MNTAMINSCFVSTFSGEMTSDVLLVVTFVDTGVGSTCVEPNVLLTVVVLGLSVSLCVLLLDSFLHLVVQM